MHPHMRLENKVAIVAGAGQTPGDTIGNGRATAILFAREGASVMLVDKNLGSAKDTEALIREEGGEAWPFEADITREEHCRELVRACIEHYGDHRHPAEQLRGERGRRTRDRDPGGELGSHPSRSISRARS